MGGTASHGINDGSGEATEGGWPFLSVRHYEYNDDEWRREIVPYYISNKTQGKSKPNNDPIRFLVIQKALNLSMFRVLVFHDFKGPLLLPS